MGRYTGKFSARRVRKAFPFLALILVLVAVASLTTGVVVAYLSASTDDLTNTFVPEESVDPSVAETFEDNTKKDVSVNVGNPGYAVYVRAAVVVTWKNEDGGDVYGEAPEEGVDYNISFNTTDWFQQGDFWYCRNYVTSGESPVLITTCSPVDGQTPDGYELNVEIITQTIQALGTTDTGDIPAVTDAWKVKVSGNQLVPTTP